MQAYAQGEEELAQMCLPRSWGVENCLEWTGNITEKSHPEAVAVVKLIRAIGAFELLPELPDAKVIPANTDVVEQDDA